MNKSKYIDAIHKSLESSLGDIHPVSYTAIEEIKADAYGYEGLTIEYKIINNKIINNRTKWCFPVDTNQEKLIQHTFSSIS